ncbi:hypothetical protein N9H45_04485 [Opitutales bacterium]|nr:hypothetical protein [Opitutales bacterium]
MNESETIKSLDDLERYVNRFNSAIEAHEFVKGEYLGCVNKVTFVGGAEIGLSPNVGRLLVIDIENWNWIACHSYDLNGLLNEGGFSSVHPSHRRCIGTIDFFLAIDPVVKKAIAYYKASTE